PRFGALDRALQPELWNSDSKNNKINDPYNNKIKGGRTRVSALQFTAARPSSAAAESFVPEASALLRAAESARNRRCRGWNQSSDRGYRRCNSGCSSRYRPSLAGSGSWLESRCCRANCCQTNRCCTTDRCWTNPTGTAGRYTSCSS